MAPTIVPCKPPDLVKTVDISRNGAAITKVWRNGAARHDEEKSRPPAEISVS
jgi:hypothetical protein